MNKWFILFMKVLLVSIGIVAFVLCSINISEKDKICKADNQLKNNKSEYEYFKNLNLDLVIIVAYGMIIPKEFLSLSKEGFINLHASILPKWRGAAPIQRSIMNKDKETGISVMKINEKLDNL